MRLNKLIAAILLFLWTDYCKPADFSSGWELKTFGQLTMSYYPFTSQNSDFYKQGYRSNFMINFEYYKKNNFVLEFDAQNTTTISKNPDSFIDLNKIRYTLAPGFKYLSKKWLYKTRFFHECMHTISRDEQNGSTYWNSLQFSIGTHGAYHEYLVDKYQTQDFTLANSVDIQQTFNCYLSTTGKSLLSQNHDYVADNAGLLRYHAFSYGCCAVYSDLDYKIWLKRDSGFDRKINASLNIVIKSGDKLLTLFYNQNFYDDSPHDNINKSGEAGLRIMF